jgi:methionine aminopeptidase
MVGAICGEVDAFIEAELLKVFSNKKSKKLERGIGFPTCLSINEVMGHFSPIPDDDVKLVNE